MRSRIELVGRVVRCRHHQCIKVQPVRTTIDLPADLHTIAGQLAHNQRVTLSQVVVDLMRRALNSPGPAQAASNIVYHPVTGFPTMRLGGGPITTEMVRQMQELPMRSPSWRQSRPGLAASSGATT
jgi:hypothetical protein